MALASGRKEALLVLRAQLGDREAFDALLERTGVWLRPYLASLTGDDHLAADVLQSTLLAIWCKLSRVHEPRAYRAWVYRIASREAFRQLRARRSLPSVSADAGPPLEAPEPFTPPDAQELDRLLAEIEALGPNTRAVIVLHYMEDLSIRHVAAVLDLPTGTVKSRLAWALAHLRDRLNQPWKGSTQ